MHLPLGEDLSDVVPHNMAWDEDGALIDANEALYERTYIPVFHALMSLFSAIWETLHEAQDR